MVALLNYNLSLLEGDKGRLREKVAGLNVEAARKGFDYGRENYGGDLSHRPEARFLVVLSISSKRIYNNP